MRVENVYQGFLPLDLYSLKTGPLQGLLLLRLLSQPPYSAENPASLFICNYPTSMLRYMQ